MTENEADKPGEGRVMELAAVGDFLLIKRGVIMSDCGLDGVMLRAVALDNNPAAQSAPSGASCHLTEQLECSFSGAEVREIKAGIGADHTDKSYQWQIQTLGYHLGADQDIGFMVAELVHNLPVGVFSFCGVTVPA